MGGALMILNHLVNKLVEKEVNFVLLKDSRCPELQSEKYIRNLIVLSSDNRTRNQYYKTQGDNFSSVLCLGNIPPCRKLKVPVYTYIHNVSLLEIPKDYPLIWKIKSYLKRAYIRHYAKYTDAWVVQTSNTANLVKEYLPKVKNGIKIYPFYKAPGNTPEINNLPREDYVFIGEHTNAKGHEYLVDAWIKLAGKGFKGKLHLTVSEPRFTGYVENAIKRGANIENHGFVKFEEVLTLYQKSKAIIYPSLNESLGLGIIEGISMCCDVIGSDMPYLHSICIPSEVFAVRNSDAIVDAVLRYEEGRSPKTQMTIRDMSEELISFLQQNG